MLMNELDTFNRQTRKLTNRAKMAIMKLLLRRQHDLSNTIVLTGLPRSGTTWLGEILNTLPNSAMLFEPLHLRFVPEAAAAGFTWNNLIHPDEDKPEAVTFMRNVLSGRVLNVWTARDLKISNCLNTEFFIVKFVRAENLLSWMAANFPIRKPLFLIRHPCAVVSSQLKRHLHDDLDKNNLLGEPIMNIYPH